MWGKRAIVQKSMAALGFAVLVGAAACTNAGGGAGGAYVPLAAGDSVASGADTNPSGSSTGEGNLATSLGVSALAPGGNFGGTTLDGAWSITFNNWSDWTKATAAVGPNSASIDFPSRTEHPDYEAADCSVTTKATIYVEFSHSGELAVGWRSSQSTFSPTCWNQYAGKGFSLLFLARRTAAGTGQMGALAGEWDVDAQGGPCHLRIGPQGLEGCLNLASEPIIATASGSTVSGHFALDNGKVEFAAQRTAPAAVVNSLGMAPLVTQAYQPGALAGDWSVKFANWSNYATGDATIAGRLLAIKFPAAINTYDGYDCGTVTSNMSLWVETAAAGDLAVVSGFKSMSYSQPDSGPCSPRSEHQPLAVLRRTSAGVGQFGSIAGKYDVWNDDGGPTCSFETGAAGMTGCAATNSAFTAVQDGPAISGKLGAEVSYTAFHK